jgi:NADH-quinone oxidoreductase subunit C
MFGTEGGSDTTGYGGLVRRVANPAVLPAGTPRPLGGWFDGAVERLESLLGDGDAAGADQAVEKVVVDRGQLTVFVRRERLLDVVRHLRDDPALRFEMCLGVSGVHYPDETGRELHAMYPFLSLTHNRRLRLEVTAPDADPHVPSIVAVYPSNNWHERETWDFFGLVFDGHPALTRIEMPDDWPGHPQRKDYPLGGIPVEYKGATVPPPDERRSYA